MDKRIEALKRKIEKAKEKDQKIELNMYEMMTLFSSATYFDKFIDQFCPTVKVIDEQRRILTLYF